MSEEGFADALLPGTRLLWFEILKVLGKGGFGITYLGRDTQLERDVAIKEYLPAAYASRVNQKEIVPNSSADQRIFEWGLDRFLREAQILAQFRHPSIVRVLNFFRSGNTAYMVMEYVEGEGLDRLLRRRKTLDELTLKRLLLPLLEGLAVLHKADYIHRDLKPANIFIRKESQLPVILDFGSARQAVAGRGEKMTSLLSLGYSPFEQYDSSGHRQGPWSDIYALGGVLYRAISGQRPLEASVRISARLRNVVDPLPTAEEVGQGKYSLEFLRAVDWALRVLENERPQSISSWQPALLGNPAGGGSAQSAAPLSLSAVPTGDWVDYGSWSGLLHSLQTLAGNIAEQEHLAAATARLTAPGVVVEVPRVCAPNLPEVVTPRTKKSGEKSPHHHSQGEEVEERAAVVREKFVQPTPEEIPPAQRQAGMIWEEPTIKMAFVWIPAGQFIMGASLADGQRKEDEGPEHEVQVQGFWLGKYPLTWGRWRRVMGDYPAGLFMNSKANHPVERVSWLDVQQFMQRLGSLVGKTTQFRLPTEAEWEYAARAGENVLPQLNRSTLEYGTEQLTDHAWFRANAKGQTHPVGEKKPNAWGLHDMLGNVWEWVQDRYQADYYWRSPRVNPQGPGAAELRAGLPAPSANRLHKSAPREFRVARGGGFNSSAQECWPTTRLRMAENSTAVTVGFRLLRQG
ncbi:bifunctional serine/threonine-protein kinase/formylglycine-generating enzyme family protein [Candidatus Magnetaquicoccus inordinatus]|uniref:bifunctional serine/threonine-protein kinase/formylglycine-generating enzyme family protein n=1 Tax=Candidatus Magnetaquicoccus inordinatus TaxID=2496818 RepID=UPI00102AFF14|nr:bifunctional serine/threonine-protein kinase/formylglycine-generating enzyme family protein [Candidatus Magnetaquicoccus inordinatus]